MKKPILITIGLTFIIGLSGCAPQLPTMFEKTTYKKYKTYPKNKALSYAKSNTTGYYVGGFCKEMKTEEAARECAIEKCKKSIKDFMEIEQSACKVYDLNDKVVWE